MECIDLKRSLFVVLSLAVTGTASAQGTREDYARAERFLPQNISRLVAEAQVAPNWIDPTSRFWYRKDTPPDKQFVLVDPEQRSSRAAFDHERLAAALSRATGKSYRAQALPFDAITFSSEGKAIEFDAEGSHWSCDLSAYECASRGPARPSAPDVFARRGTGRPEAGERDITRSPDGAWVAFLRDYNLWLRSAASGQKIQLTTDGEKAYAYATPLSTLSNLVAQQAGTPPLGPIVSWSPDSTKIATFRLDQRSVPPMSAVQYAPPGRMLPQAYTYTYPLPLIPVLPTAAPLIFEVKTRKRIEVDARPVELFWGGGGPRFSWFKDGRGIYWQEIERGYKRVGLLAADAVTGKVCAMVEEKAETYVDMSKFSARMVKDGAEVIMSSERDGWNHLYLFDGASGALKNRITSGDWLVRAIEHINEDRRQVYFSAAGKERGEDPYLRRLYRAGLDGSGLTLLTPENADHAVTFSPDGKFIVDNYSRVDLPPVAVLRDSQDGARILELEKADISKLTAAGWKQPERFKAKARDGKTDIYGVLWRPSNFDPSKKYPIVEQIYTGPHGFFAPATFSAFRNTCQSIAELGFLSIMIDGMGTNMRSRAFHEVSYKNLGDGGIPDHIAAMKQLAEKYPYMDLTRVGIFGHSAGGYDSTHALLTHPEFYKACVSSAGNHDARLDKSSWIEQWMGYPVGKHYEEQSNYTLAGNLKGRLLLAVGDVDENVPPVATFRMVDALIKANKDFDLIVMPNRGHGFGAEPYFVRRRWDHFVRHLLGVAPPEGYQIRARAESAVPDSGR